MLFTLAFTSVAIFIYDEERVSKREFRRESFEERVSKKEFRRGLHSPRGNITFAYL